MKLPFIFIGRKKYKELVAYRGMFHSAKAGIEERKKELSQLKNDISLSELQSVAETEKLRQENKELKEKLLTAIFGNQEYEKLCKTLKNQLTELQKPLMQDDKDRQIKNLKLKIEAKEKELEEQKKITHFKNQIINGLKGYTEPRKDLEEKYSKI